MALFWQVKSMFTVAQTALRGMFTCAPNDNDANEHKNKFIFVHLESLSLCSGLRRARECNAMEHDLIETLGFYYTFMIVVVCMKTLS